MATAANLSPRASSSDEDTAKPQLKYIGVDFDETEKHVEVTPPMTSYYFIDDEDSSDDLDDESSLHESLQPLWQSNSAKESDSNSEEKASLDIDHIMGYDKIDDYAKIEAPELVQEDTIEQKVKFLANLTVPSLSDISEEHELDNTKSKVISDTQGKFVNPIDEKSNSTSSEKSNSEGAEYKTITPESTKTDSIYLISTSSADDMTINSDGLDSLDFKIFQPPVRKETNLTFEKSLVHGFRTNSLIAPEPTYKEEWMELAKGFLTELINQVVNKVETEIANDLASDKFDKKKLMDELLLEFNNCLVEREFNHFLNGKMYEYFKRGQNTRTLSSLPPREHRREYLRYIAALNLLDHRLKVAAETKKRTAFLMSSVSMDLSYILNIVMGTEEHFEDLVTKTLTTNRSDYLKHVVERELRYMSQKRYEISDTRLFLITRKHTLGRMADKIKKLETINEDICMDDFITIQNQVVALTKKMEERNSDIKRMSQMHYSELHQLQHNREKAKILRSKFKIYESLLLDKQMEEDSLRGTLCAVKLERNKIRKDYSDLSYRGGLMAMPALMYDFDETVNKIKIKKASIDELKESIKKISQRVAEFEARCA
ncbi:PREDICTED: golgin subfamily A member 3-like [Drosophila arizonae]|uniref:Golgin subfamily A member 3-like n=1 Tax=Drosophila arizonae TaxID=7263 RepID=A0ABM1PM37_DROAR|nr:PREDICTED: golgin subfamily A member 3-like [Drosophila arizonae]